MAVGNLLPQRCWRSCDTYPPMRMSSQQDKSSSRHSKKRLPLTAMKLNGKLRHQHSADWLYATDDIPAAKLRGRTLPPSGRFGPEDSISVPSANVEDEECAYEEETSSLDSNFLCACCYELMVQPTTLNCGHSFCRLCLAQWWRTSQKTTCPQCRQPWSGFPHVNIIIRNTLDKIHPSTVRKRSASLDSYENIRLLQEFEEFGEQQEREQQGAGGRQDRLRKGFVWGVLTTLGLVFFFQILFNWNRQDSEMLVYKPLARWKPADVSQWLSELGTWAAEGYCHHFEENGINGVLLEGLQSEVELETEPFNINNSLHRQAIHIALEKVKQLGGKPPRDLWEYKALHQGLATFLSYTVREFPRLTMTGMYMFYYEDVFLPFIHMVCPVQSSKLGDTDIIVQYYSEDIAWEQWVEFIPKFLFLPYYLYAKFSWQFADVNALPVAFTLANCAFLTMVEAKAITAFFRRGVRTTFFSLKRQTNTLVVIFFSCLLWPIIPTVVTDLMFYISMYYSPCINFYEVFMQ
ncbi:bifunctional apoptosis regulator-like [Diadema antillarum]|uniref:bifunctional apoptosis regulator-like n=1 Tax=Diadema antillarum TaxID=105358 RepID=UPI003A875520